jgi:serine/threonine protein kinase
VVVDFVDECVSSRTSEFVSREVDYKRKRRLASDISSTDDRSPRRRRRGLTNITNTANMHTSLNPSELKFMSPEQQAAEYVVVRKLGEGSYGFVNEVVTPSGEVRAVKCLKSKTRSHEIAAYREVQCSRALQHPNIIATQDIFNNAEGTFIVLEHAQCTVQQLLELGHGPTPTGQLRDLVHDLLSGLAHMHAESLMHRDIKPDNLVLCRRDPPTPTPTRPETEPPTTAAHSAPRPAFHHSPASSLGGSVASSGSTEVLKIIDFSLARPVAAAGAGGGGNTPSCSVATYAAPELCAGLEEYGPPVDVWAAGVVMAELLVGGPFFTEQFSDIGQLHEIGRVLGGPRPGPAAAPAAGCVLRQARAPATATAPSSVGAAESAAGPPGGEGGGVRAQLRAKQVGVPDEEAASLLEQLLCVDPADRPTAAQALRHPFFR